MRTGELGTNPKRGQEDTGGPIFRPPLQCSDPPVGFPIVGAKWPSVGAKLDSPTSQQQLATGPTHRPPPGHQSFNQKIYISPFAPSPPPPSVAQARPCRGRSAGPSRLRGRGGGGQEQGGGGAGACQCRVAGQLPARAWDRRGGLWTGGRPRERAGACAGMRGYVRCTCVLHMCDAHVCCICAHVYCACVLNMHLCMCVGIAHVHTCIEHVYCKCALHMCITHVQKRAPIVKWWHSRAGIAGRRRPLSSPPKPCPWISRSTMWVRMLASSVFWLSRSASTCPPKRGGERLAPLG